MSTTQYDDDKLGDMTAVMSVCVLSLCVLFVPVEHS